MYMYADSGRPKRKRQVPEWLDNAVVTDGSVRLALQAGRLPKETANTTKDQGPNTRRSKRYQEDHGPRGLPRWGRKKLRSKPHGEDDESDSPDNNPHTMLTLDSVDAAAVAGLNSLANAIHRIPAGAMKDSGDLVALRKSLMVRC